MKVWLAFYEPGFEATEIYGVYASEDSAKARIAIALGEMGAYGDKDDYAVKEFDVES